MTPEAKLRAMCANHDEVFKQHKALREQLERAQAELKVTENALLLSQGEINLGLDQYSALREALKQIAILAEYATSGSGTNPRCKSDALSAQQATALRGSISDIARSALGQSEQKDDVRQSD